MPGGDSDIMIPMKQENESYCIGQVVEGMITGIKPYGAFVRLNDGASGLIHISEVANAYVRDVNDYLKAVDIIRHFIWDQQLWTSWKRPYRKCPQGVPC